MRSLLHLARHFLASHPNLRRKIVNVVYRLPFLDMRLRAALDKRDDLSWQRVDAEDLPEEVQVVYERLRHRIEHR